MSGTAANTANRPYDAVVVGGGSGGIAFAKRAAHLGARVVLVEREALGGTCANRGCVPKKLLWQAARTIRGARDLHGENLSSGVPAFRMDAWRAAKDTKVQSIRDSYAETLEEAGVTVMRGEAKIDGEGTVHMDDGRLAAERVVLATGAQPVRLSFPGSEHMVVSNDVLSWDRLPRRMVVVGGGYIGCEFATIFDALGVEIVLVDEDDALLAGFDSDAVELITDLLRRRSVKVLLETGPERIERNGDALIVHLKDGTRIDCDAAVCAVGRKPDLEALGAIAQSLETADNGTVRVDDSFRTSVEGVYAIGDVADRMPLTPVAIRDGTALADLFWQETAVVPADLDQVARAVFTMPPLAQVGSLDAPGADVALSRSNPLQAGVLLSEHNAEGSQLHKLVRKDGRLQGAVLVAEDAPDAIGVLASLVALSSDDTALEMPVAIHPTFVEEFVGTN